ncbi:MAG TPA: 2-phospho-L-lactate guanylyltransferase [Pedococcus sp.]|jgi:2-phospho-L-lactate guanylyltransferase|uniref:2-phospho-L-lactate guanylyltransferase n=1 Tax=Pedococcus sp. TaxID=2860345 RepID=UPI002F9419FF
MTPVDPAAWQLVVPVKGGAGAKSRLHPPTGISRADLAFAIASDCLAAACSGMPRGRVCVVTSDAAVARVAEGLGALVVPDPGQGLNAAVSAGLAAASRGGSTQDARSEGHDLAVLLGDVPALRAGDLADALAAAAAHERAVVPDADGTGTVLLTSRTGHLDPAFGAGSAARHERAGHRRLELDLPHLRTDVDDDRSLAAATALGLGPATTACLAAAGATLPDVQASVHTFDESTGAGSALLDDGQQVAFPADVFARSALRHLRTGQRISIDLAADGRTVERLWIVGIGDDQRIG